ncbi:MAG: glycosyltransferase family 39 protein [Bacteroidota bacterium]
MKSKSPAALILYSLSGVVLLGTLLFRFRLLHLPIDRDEGEYAYAGWRMIHGGVSYIDYYNMKMPGIYGAYAFLFLIFGSTIEAIRIGLIIVNIANAYFVYRLGKKWGDQRNGIFASICYLVFSMQVELQGTCSHAEHFAMFFVLPAILLFISAWESKSQRKYFFSGVLFGLAFLMKQPAFSFIIMATLLLVLLSAGNKPGWKVFLKSLFSLGAGTSLPFLITAATLFVEGAGKNFMLFAFSYAKEYVSFLGLRDGWNGCLVALSSAVPPNLLLWVLVPLSIIMLLFTGQKMMRIYRLVFFLFSFIAVSAGFYFRPHYFQFVLPAVAILAASVLSGWEPFWKKRNGPVSKLQFFTIPFLVIAILFFVFNERSLFSIRTDEDFIRKIYHQDFFNATKKAGDFIAANSKPDSRIAIFGAEPEIWFYSKRLAASGYLYVYPLLENQKFAASMREQFYSEMEKSKPDIILYTSNEGTWYANPAIQEEMVKWMNSYRDTGFKRIALIDLPFNGETAYYWTEDTAIYPTNQENYIEIYKRK